MCRYVSPFSLSLCITPFPLESVVVQSRASRDLVGGQHDAGVPPDRVRRIRHKRSTTEDIIKRVPRRRGNPHLRPPRPRQGGGGDGRGGGGGGQRLFGPRLRPRRPVPRLPHRSPSLAGVIPCASGYQTGARGAPPQDACGWWGRRGVRPPRRVAWYVSNGHSNICFCLKRFKRCGRIQVIVCYIHEYTPSQH